MWFLHSLHSAHNHTIILTAIPHLYLTGNGVLALKLSLTNPNLNPNCVIISTKVLHFSGRPQRQYAYFQQDRVPKQKYINSDISRYMYRHMCNCSCPNVSEKSETMGHNNMRFYHAMVMLKTTIVSWRRKKLYAVYS